LDAVNTPVITVNNQTTTLGVAVAGTNGLAKAGGGGLTLTNVNTYTGTTVVSAGTLKLDGSLIASSTAPLSSGKITNSSTVAFYRNATGLTPITASLSGAGDYYVDGPGGGTIYDYRICLRGSNSDNTGTIYVTNSGKLWVDLAGVNAIGDSASVNVGPSAKFYIYQPITETIGGLAGSGNVYGGDAAGISSLVVGGGNISAAFSGVLQNGLSPNTFTLTKIGTGTQTLSGASTYTGATTVSNGTLLVNGSLAAGTTTTVRTGAMLGGVGTLNGPVVLNAGGTLTAGTNAIGTLTIANTLTLDPGSTNYMRISKTGGTLTNDLVKGLTGALSYQGTLVVANVTSDTTPLVAGDKFTLFTKTSGGYGGGFGAFVLPTLDSGLSWDKSGLTVDGSIMVVNRVGTPTFTPAAGGYIGATVVTISSDVGATIFYTTDGSTPTNSSAVYSGPILVPVDSSMTIQAYATNAGFADSFIAIASYVTMSKAIWVNAAGGSWQIAPNWSNNVVGAGRGATADFSLLTMASNTLVTLDGAQTIGNLVFGDAGNAYNWMLNAGTSGSLTLDAATSPVIAVGNQTTTIGAILSGTNGLVKTGPGALTLSANNSLAGGVTVNAGTLLLSQTNANNFGTANSPVGSGTLTVNSGGLVQKAAHFQVSGLNNTNNTSHVVVNGGTFEFGAFQEYLRSIDLTGGTIHGTSTVDHIIIRAPADLTINSLSSANTSVIDGSGIGKLDLTFGNLLFNVADGAAATDLLITTAISENTGAGSGSKNVTKTGAGTLVLGGTNTYSGTTTVSNGTLRINGSLGGGAVLAVGGSLGGSGVIGGPVTLQGGASLAPGGDVIGTLTVSNTLTLNDGSTTALRLDRNNSQTSDRVSGLTSLSAGGTLQVSNIGGSLQAGDTFSLFNTVPTASFAATNLPSLASGQNWWTPDNFATLNVNQVNAGTVSYNWGRDMSLKILITDLLTNVTSVPLGGDSFMLVGVGPSTNAASITSDASYIYYSSSSNADDTFTYSVSDARGGSATGVINVQVVSVTGPSLGAGNVSIANNTATVSVYAIPGYSYILQTATGLSGPWWPVVTNTADAHGFLQFTDPNATNTMQFYRLAQP
jgi:autotransporter-associated beta strand protein